MLSIGVLEMDWDVTDFLNKLKAGEFEGGLLEELSRLSPEQLRALEELLKRTDQEPSE